jgi:hypothetical protein
MFLGTKGERLSLRQQQLSKRLAAKVTTDVDNDHTVTSSAVKVDENTTTTDTEKIIKTNKRNKKEEKLSKVEKSSSIASKSRDVKKKDVVNERI